MNGKVLVSIISVDYNSHSDTYEFLESLRKSTYPDVEIILVDNASRENPEEEIRKRFPEVHFIRSIENRGFAAGNNLGLKVAKGDYILFLNNDTIVPAEFIGEMVEFMQQNPKVGMASPKVLYADGKTLQYTGALRINPLTGRGKRLGLFEPDQGQYDKVYPTDLPHGAALIVPRYVIDKIGPMPEIYFLYYEEHDWCEQARKAGYPMWYVGTSSIIHKESVSTGGAESYLKVYYLNRNRILYLRRNYSGLTLFAGIMFYLALAFPKNILKYTLNRQWHLLKALKDGLAWNLQNAPR